jgi:hypothetical protein
MAYREPLAAADEVALAGALDQQIFDGAPAEPSRALATYTIAAARGLDAHDEASIAGGQVTFPSPASIGGIP